MRRVTTICCSAFALLLCGSGTLFSWADVERKSTEVPLLVPTRPIWTLALNNAITVAPAFDATRAFFPITEDRVAAYEIASGKQLWVAAASPQFAPVASGDLLFLIEADSLNARRASDGSVAWKVSLAEKFSRPLLLHDDLLVGVTDGGSVRAYRTKDGALAWQRDIGAAAHAAAAAAGMRLYVPASNGTVIALSMADGAVIWARKIGGLPNEVLALERRIFVGSTDNFFYCLLAETGAIDWRWRTGADVIGVPVADSRRVYFVSLDNVLRGMNQVTGAQEWMRALAVRPTSGPVLAGGTIAVAGQSPIVRTFAAKDGAPSADIPAGDEVGAPLYSLTDGGTGLPMIVIATRHVVKGASVLLIGRSIEPTQIPVIAPLPGVVTPAPTPATR